ncbi:substrate-binding domain-containing protein [Clostridia bacterium OttesenSCG-928-F22]|nr:substrate-binding domain-containing protein [Clostridia bacterium OttesenSCG-928-F22]
MKKVFILMIVLLLGLTACNSSTPTPTASTAITPSGSMAATQGTQQTGIVKASGLTLDGGEYPVMDGSTACLPLMARVRAAVTGVPLREAEELTSCSTTPDAYKKLVQGDVDILLVYEPAINTQTVIEASGVKLESTPVGRDALVFITNKENPVNSLTTEQLVDIYTGDITNWNQVGGEGKAIRAFQRAEESGSQALFIKLLMKDKTPMEVEKYYYPKGMGDLIEELVEYTNEADALGFSVFYYAAYMYVKPELKFIGVNGVAPSDSTLMDKTYPLTNDFYVVIREDAAQDSPARRLRDWICTEEGRKTLIDAGYIPAD